MSPLFPLRRIAFFALLISCIFGSVPARALPASTAEFPVLCYHEVEEELTSPYPDSMPQRAYQFISQLNWLYENGYKTITVDDMIAFRSGKRSPAPGEFLLTVDDGYASFYKYVYPLLKAYDYKAILAINGVWTDAAPGTSVLYGSVPVSRDFFLSIPQLREISDSGYVEIASHSYDLHRAVPADETGSMIPQIVTLEYRSETNSYQTPKELYRLVENDMKKISDLILRVTGRRPRVHVWPFGRYTKWGARLAEEAGMEFSFVLKGEEENEVTDLPVVFRYLVLSEETAGGIAYQLRAPWEPAPVRTIKVDLDDLCDADPAVVNKRLDFLIQRLHEMKPSSVLLKGYSDSNGDGKADSLYFANRHLPVRANLLPLVAWRLERKIARVIVSMPMRDFELTGLHPAGNGDFPMAQEYDDNPGREARIVREIYEDLAAHVIMQGIHFDDFGKYVMSAAEPMDAAKVKEVVANAKALEKILLNWSETKPGGIYEIPVSYFLKYGDDPGQACALLGLGTYGKDNQALVDFQDGARRTADVYPLIKHLQKGLKNAPQYARNLILNIGPDEDHVQKTGIPESEEIAALMSYAQRSGFRNIGLSFYDFVRDLPPRARIIPYFSLRSFEYEVRRPDVIRLKTASGTK